MPCRRSHVPYDTAMPTKPDWPSIDTVLLDLDGTLLDLGFDNHFWREHIPAAYAAARSLPLDEARTLLAPRFQASEGTLNWYCIEHWSRELGLDVAALKRAQAEYVRWLPGAREFLERLRAMGKRLVLVTNAHPETLRIKDERAGVTRYMDAVHSSHDYGAPKEQLAFWSGLYAAEPFEHDRTVFVDDSPAVLRAAREAGIRWIFAVRRPDTSAGTRHHEDFPSVDSVIDLL